MKKTLVTALTTALVVGAASTTFANAFEDVPADHWANDAIAQLTADGVIEGYGDGTYRGDQAITRYEVAQIVARAMAKENVSAANKATIDKLASEFAEELNSLGVRVSALEKKVDNVKWTGTLRWRTVNRKVESENRESLSYITFRLEPEATVNAHWKVNARIDTYGNENNATQQNNMENAANGSTVRVERAWATGTYGTTEILLGKLPYVTNVDNGMIFDDNVTGAQVNFGNEQVKATVTAGRMNLDPDSGNDEETYDYQGIEVYNDRDAKVTWGVGYHHTGSKVANGDAHSAANILALGLGYKFNDCVALNGAYAHNAGFEFKNESVDSSWKQAYSIELDYKGADQEQPGSYGLFAAYRHLGGYAVLSPTYDAVDNDGAKGFRGWEFGADVCLDKNITATLKYGTGNQIDGGETFRKFFSEVNFFF